MVKTKWTDDIPVSGSSEDQKVRRRGQADPKDIQTIPIKGQTDQVQTWRKDSSKERDRRQTGVDRGQICQWIMQGWTQRTDQNGHKPKLSVDKLDSLTCKWTEGSWTWIDN